MLKGLGGGIIVDGKEEEIEKGTNRERRVVDEEIEKLTGGGVIVGGPTSLPLSSSL